MPYVITTSMASRRFGADGKRVTTPLSRIAVATLKGVAERLVGVEAPEGWNGLRDEHLPWSFTTPGGTVIEVENLSPLMLMARTSGDKGALAVLVRGCLDDGDFQPLIDAFNADPASTGRCR